MDQEIAEWLKELGLAELAPAFDGNGIDRDLLRELTNQDLIDIGVARLVDRKRILKAAAELGPVARPEADPVAERRQITAVFVDMADSTGLSSRLDPEDYHDALLAYQTACSDVVAGYGGQIARLLGDGILIYFGYPHTMEDDAQRAVLACLDMQNAIARLPPVDGFVIRARMGIATGVVMIADIHTDSLAEEGVMSGDTPILAARLQSVAAPGDILIAERTWRLAGNQFRYADPVVHDLKGIDRPENVRKVLGAISQADRQSVGHRQGEVMLIGRDRELAAIRALWQSAVSGTGAVAVLSGEPGIGKSHLVNRICNEVEQSGALAFRHYGSRYHQNSPLYPIITFLEAAAGFEAKDDRPAKRRKLESYVSRLSDDADTLVPLLASLLSASPEGSELSLSAQQQKEQTLDGLVHLLVRTARRYPVLLVVDDLQWIDPTSRELLTRVSESIADLPTLMILTTRPDQHDKWEEFADLRHIALDRLTPAQTRKLVHSAAPGVQLDPDVVDEIVDRADGVPLFVTEITRSVFQSITDQGDAEKSGQRMTTVRKVPGSLYESLMSRIDKLGDARETIMLAAVLGRTFTHEELLRVSRSEPAELDRAIAEMAEAGLVQEAGDTVRGGYEFRHSLVQEVCYDSLVRKRRAELHRRAAEALEAHFPRIVSGQPEVIARHFSYAGLPGQALLYWEKAGARAARRSATHEAISHFRAALEQVDRMPDTDARQDLRLKFLIQLGAQLQAAYGFASREVQDSYNQAFDLCRERPKSAAMLPVYWGLWGYYIVSANLRQAHELGETFLSLAQSLDDRSATVAAHYALGVTNFHAGDSDKALSHLRAALKNCRVEESAMQQDLYGLDLTMACHAYLSWTLSIRGDRDAALAASRESLKVAADIGHDFSHAYALIFAAQMYHFLDEAGAAQKFEESATRLSAERGFAHWAGQALSQRGRHMDVSGNPDGMDLVQAGWDAVNQTGSQLGGPYIGAWLGDALLRRGQTDKALSVVEATLATNGKFGEHYYDAELLRLKGAIMRAKGDEKAAVAILEQALALARSQKAGTLLERIRNSFRMADT